MQQRSDPHGSLEDFPTQPWAARALVEHVITPRWLKPAGPGVFRTLKGQWCWEPAANRGFLVHGLRDYFGGYIYSTDVHDYGWGGLNGVADFLYAATMPPNGVEIDWIITNPPFELGREFILRALSFARVGVAMFVRTSFLEGQERYADIFSTTPPTIVAQFVERVPLFKGLVRDPSVRYWDPNGKDKKTGRKTGCWKRPSTATSYAWLVWIKGAASQPFCFIPPCRRKLERPGDYALPTI